MTKAIESFYRFIDRLYVNKFGFNASGRVLVPAAGAHCKANMDGFGCGHAVFEAPTTYPWMPQHTGRTPRTAHGIAVSANETYVAVWTGNGDLFVHLRTPWTLLDCVENAYCSTVSWSTTQDNRLYAVINEVLSDIVYWDIDMECKPLASPCCGSTPICHVHDFVSCLAIQDDAMVTMHYNPTGDDNSDDSTEELLEVWLNAHSTIPHDDEPRIWIKPIHMPTMKLGGCDGYDGHIGFVGPKQLGVYWGHNKHAPLHQVVQVYCSETATLLRNVAVGGVPLHIEPFGISSIAEGTQLQLTFGAHTDADHVMYAWHADDMTRDFGDEVPLHVHGGRQWLHVLTSQRLRAWTAPNL